MPVHTRSTVKGHNEPPLSLVKKPKKNHKKVVTPMNIQTKPTLPESINQPEQEVPRDAPTSIVEEQIIKEDDLVTQDSTPIFPRLSKTKKTKKTVSFLIPGRSPVIKMPIRKAKIISVQNLSTTDDSETVEPTNEAPTIPMAGQKTVTKTAMRRQKTLNNIAAKKKENDNIKKTTGPNKKKTQEENHSIAKTETIPRRTRTQKRKPELEQQDKVSIPTSFEFGQEIITLSKKRTIDQNSTFDAVENETYTLNFPDDTNSVQIKLSEMSLSETFTIDLDDKIKIDNENKEMPTKTEKPPKASKAGGKNRALARSASTCVELRPRRNGPNKTISNDDLSAIPSLNRTTTATKNKSQPSLVSKKQKELEMVVNPKSVDEKKEMTEADALGAGALGHSSDESLKKTKFRFGSAWKFVSLQGAALVSFNKINKE